MIIVITALVAVAAIAYVLGVRPKDLPEPEAVSPFAHLDDRKAAIYENLRDLQFEYRLGKLSDEDYQNTKKDLQKELAAVLAEVDRVKAELGAGQAPPEPRKQAAPSAAAVKAGQGVGRAASGPPHQNGGGNVCPSCGARFEQDLKFCGECGKPMKVTQG